MNVLMIGDVVGSRGCEFVAKHLSSLKKLYGIDLVIANGENSADGNGMTPHSADSLMECGVDIITAGNHTFRRKEIYGYLDEKPYIIRPANYPESAPGRGICYFDMCSVKAAVCNISGTVYLESLACPFETADRLIEEAKKENAKIIIIDFHAEATGEKRALGFYLDGRCSIISGTHTHIQTSDLQILSSGTGYITDIGMTGPVDSVLGVKPELAISKMKDKLPVRFDYASGDYSMNAVLFSIDNATGQTVKCEYINVT